MNNGWAKSGGFAFVALTCPRTRASRSVAPTPSKRRSPWRRPWPPAFAGVTCLPIAVRAAALALAVFAARAQAGETAVTCTNPASGASWRIAIDFDRGTVDSNPARITDSEISWRDAKDGWRYTLDRKTGKLTVVLASATGGNFLYDQCKLPK